MHRIHTKSLQGTSNRNPLTRQRNRLRENRDRWHRPVGREDEAGPVLCDTCRQGTHQRAGDDRQPGRGGSLRLCQLLRPLDYGAGACTDAKIRRQLLLPLHHGGHGQQCHRVAAGRVLSQGQGSVRRPSTRRLRQDEHQELLQPAHCGPEDRHGNRRCQPPQHEPGPKADQVHQVAVAIAQEVCKAHAGGHHRRPDDSP
jgi:hypothetical protein